LVNRNIRKGCSCSFATESGRDRHCQFSLWGAFEKFCKSVC